MERQIRYVKTSDGVNIAYAVFGTGPTILFAGSIWGNIHLYKTALFRAWTVYDELALLGWSVVVHDGRGMGSSDRDPDDYTLQGRIRDLEAVIERVAPERFVLCGNGQGGPAAVAYAVQHLDRVTHLILGDTFASGSEYYSLVPAMRVSQNMLPLAEDEWEFHTLTLASAITRFADSELAHKIAAAFRASMTPKAYIAYREAAAKIDVQDLLPRVEVPTLVVHLSDWALARGGELTRRIATLIPGARFVETGDLAKTIDEFLQEGGLEPSPPALRAEPSPERGRGERGTASTGMTAIFFADVADSTALTERLGDTAFREKARDLDGALRAIIRDNAGTPIEGKLLGDGVLAVFTSARQAIEAALACGRAGDDGELPLHLGLHAGDVIRESDPDGRSNVYGGAVNIASRISGLSAPGEVLVSDIVRGLARTSAGVRFEDRGEQSLKGVGEAVRVWAVREG